MKIKIFNLFCKPATISPEAQAVLNLMSGLTTQQTNAIIAFVDSQVLANNWTCLDVFQCYALGAANGLKDWFGNFNATNPDGFSFVAGGVSLPGGNTSIALRTGYNPSDAGNKRTVNDSVEGVYTYSNLSTTDQRVLLAISGTTLWNQRTIASRLDFIHNGVARNVVTYPTGYEKGMWTAQTFTGGTTKIWKDNSDLGAGSAAGRTLPNAEIILGGRLASNQVYQGVLSGYYSGKIAGFNVATFANGFNQLLTDLGL